MKGADLDGANLNRAKLLGANLSGANLKGADLGDANLKGATLIGASLDNARFNGAHLQDAYLNNAILTGADMTGADLSRAITAYTVFGNVELSTVRGLDTVDHQGPSTIGPDTIYKSKGRIPESFLRGCGVPENFITYMRSLTGAALEFYSVFISYPTKDEAFANRLHADLQARGVRCWFAPHDIQGGKKIQEQIDEAIRVYDKLLLVLSDASMTSEWVSTEISKARKRERQENRRMLFPISLAVFESIREWECFDADAGKDSAREIREFFIPDFSNWKDHDSYQQVLDRLVRDLKAAPASHAEA